MVPNRVPASGCQGRQSALPSIPLVCGMQAGPPHTLLTIPLQPFGPAWVTCMSSASQQPCGGVSQGRGCLCPLTAWQCQGRRGCRGVGGASQPQASGPVPQLRRPLGFAAKEEAATGGAGLGHAGQARPCCCSLVELPLTSGRRLPCLHGDQTVSAAPPG